MEPRGPLSLSQVMDPMNLGALLRTAHFLGVDGVVVCEKNSAALSPTVSKASAGALECMDVHSTRNMPQFLAKCAERGWRVVGTGLGDARCVPLRALDAGVPSVVVLGNEGAGMRKMVRAACAALVRVEGADAAGADDDAGVDSLNVSVTGGIVLHHLLVAQRAAAPGAAAPSPADGSDVATP